MYECRCEGDRNGLRVSVSKGRVMRICDSCKGWWYEGYSSPVTRRPNPRVLRRITVNGSIKILFIEITAHVAERVDARDLKSLD